MSGRGPAIGVVVPHDMPLDRELWRWTPDDVTLLFTRTPYSPLEVTAELEVELGKPVITANQATMWAALRLVGRQAVGPGQRLIEQAETTLRSVA
ncbi:hypothetical protein [Microlunatus soli]|uniref:Uncharacterized protein n=1 Tax=Microlunatus soli TaxID=630515 RepID=A0A1H1WDR6_9ACTN|nr:hypothetical protein [Microlunatus soli]SDS95538.1 hypothetical protein SAMN04489812_3619 [Microlunatus soli]